jgi:ribosomal protein S20
MFITSVPITLRGFCKCWAWVLEGLSEATKVAEMERLRSSGERVPDKTCVQHLQKPSIPHTITPMPITSSAKKALRQNVTRHKRNVIRKDAYKKQVTSFRKLIVAKKNEEAAAALPMVFKALDKAAKVKVIEKNKASRLKSRLSQLMSRSTKASS